MVSFETELLGRALYVEVHNDGTPWEPMRQAIFRVYRYGEALRLRTYEFREADRADVLANLWLAPEAMNALVCTKQSKTVAPNIDYETDWPDLEPTPPGHAKLRTLCSALNHMPAS